ncbi:relaxase/mobilization nuclease domain-containing protein [Chamaesiphon polymorphus]|uniref:Relaxase/mobilization nuclease n=1 Tax=Chamaesiphon polymorphus CCALA 037 TaxID=2107692 RepID=A0A2T1GNX9_9CYAN|nr:relaxase/mobilization nuclease domain-containing protein [Chamaesiphon polymorphus]PSB59565.1 relaxase/mobilization nuclease [Chamaesiphon polymorphus CCALA 037]
MIGKISKGNGFGGVLGYLLDPDKRPRIISSCLESKTQSDMAIEFRRVSNLNRRVSKPVRHFSIAFAPEDKQVDDVIKEAIALRVLEALGYKECQYIAIDHHRDDPGHDEAHDHDHLHIVANGVDVFGKHVHPQWDMYKIQNALRKVEAEFGLRQIESSWDVKRAKIRQQETKIAKSDLEIVKIVEDSLQPNIDLKRWLDSLAKNTVDVRFNLTSKNVVRGITFVRAGKAYKGSDLGASWQKVRGKLTPDRQDLELMEEANLRIRDRPVKLNLADRSIFDRLTELARMKLDGKTKFENGRIKIKCDGNTLSVYRIRPNKLMLNATRVGNDWEPSGFPDIDLRDVQLLERLNKITPQQQTGGRRRGSIETTSNSQLQEDIVSTLSEVNLQISKPLSLASLNVELTTIQEEDERLQDEDRLSM